MGDLFLGPRGEISYADGSKVAFCLPVEFFLEPKDTFLTDLFLDSLTDFVLDLPLVSELAICSPKLTSFARIKSVSRNRNILCASFKLPVPHGAHINGDDDNTAMYDRHAQGHVPDLSLTMSLTISVMFTSPC
jgi:hypothetical protein